MENPIKMDDLGVLLFSETSVCSISHFPPPSQKKRKAPQALTKENDEDVHLLSHISKLSHVISNFHIFVPHLRKMSCLFVLDSKFWFIKSRKRFFFRSHSPLSSIKDFIGLRWSRALLYLSPYVPNARIWNGDGVGWLGWVDGWSWRFFWNEKWWWFFVCVFLVWDCS